MANLFGCGRKGQDCNIPSPFDSNGHLSLVLCTVPGDPTRNDLSSFRYKKSEDPRIFIVDIKFFIGAESTDLSPNERFLLPVDP